MTSLLDKAMLIAKLILLLALAALITGLTSCTSRPQQPDPFDAAMNSFVATMFDTEGQPRP